MAVSMMPNRDGPSGALAAAKAAAQPPADALARHTFAGEHPVSDALHSQHTDRLDGHDDVLSDHADIINDLLGTADDHDARLSKLEGHDDDGGDSSDDDSAPAAGDGHDGDA